MKGGEKGGKIHLINDTPIPPLSSKLLKNNTFRYKDHFCVCEYGGMGGGAKREVNSEEQDFSPGDFFFRTGGSRFA